jgi:hypothetical protein
LNKPRIGVQKEFFKKRVSSEVQTHHFPAFHSVDLPQGGLFSHVSLLDHVFIKHLAAVNKAVCP